MNETDLKAAVDSAIYAYLDFIGVPSNMAASATKVLWNGNASLVLTLTGPDVKAIADDNN